MKTDLLPQFPANARILDAGGWFIPYHEATHIVDLMPYETRGGMLNLSPLANERFSRETWHQADFLDPQFKLPFPDKFFDYSVCGHTVEDLENPVPLLSELRRVSLAGYIETPSRLSEQTSGIRDRMTALQGHPHHHWIVESEGDQLLLSGKNISVQGPDLVPLRTYERKIAQGTGSPIMQFQWRDNFKFIVLSDKEVTRRANWLVESCMVSREDRILDPIIRNLRRIKRGLLHPTTEQTQNWWEEMLKISRPYSKIPL